MGFEDLEVWKRSAKLSSEIFLHFKSSRDFGFKDQITRSSLSVPSNIAEGSERRTNKEFINFLSFARGSIGELRTQIYIGININYITKDVGMTWISESKEITKMLTALMNSLKTDH